MSDYSHINDVSVNGSIRSSAQGKLVGALTLMPTPSEATRDQVILYIGETGEFVKGKLYFSNGSTWALMDTNLNAPMIVDVDLSFESTNPVQNKAVHSALATKLNITDTADKASADAEGNIITDTYATKTELGSATASMCRYREAVSGFADLPQTGIAIGDTYAVLESKDGIPSGSFWMWDGSNWKPFSGALDLSAYLTSALASETYATKTELTEGLATQQDVITVSNTEPPTGDGVDGMIWVTYE